MRKSERRIEIESIPVGEVLTVKDATQDRNFCNAINHKTDHERYYKIKFGLIWRIR